MSYQDTDSMQVRAVTYVQSTANCVFIRSYYHDFICVQGTFGTMGVGLGFAIAAQLYCQTNHPTKRVICVEGDSAFGFSGMEVETMFRWDFNRVKNLSFLVFVEGSFHFVIIF